MAFELNLSEPIMHSGSDAESSLKQKRNAVSVPTTGSETVNGCFDCNICLDSAHEPVVTLCGHLYCWPCIYKWLQVQSPSLESEEQPKCPVCKAYISASSLVPLYGRGTTSESEAKKPKLDLVVPQRPQALGPSTLIASAGTASDLNQQDQPNPLQPRSRSFQQYFPTALDNYASISPSSFRGATMAGFFSPTVGVFGEMVFTTMFGSSNSSLFAHPNSYPFPGNGSPRMRRQEMQVDKSLNRVSIFLLCCFILCLLLF